MVLPITSWSERICEAEPLPAPTLTFKGALRRQAPFWGHAYLLPGLLQMLIVPNHVWQIQENKYIAVLRAKMGMFFPRSHPQQITQQSLINISQDQVLCKVLIH